MALWDSLRGPLEVFGSPLEGLKTKENQNGKLRMFWFGKSQGSWASSGGPWGSLGGSLGGVGGSPGGPWASLGGLGGSLGGSPGGPGGSLGGPREAPKTREVF